MRFEKNTKLPRFQTHSMGMFKDPWVVLDFVLVCMAAVDNVLFFVSAGKLIFWVGDLHLVSGFLTAFLGV